eukprot:scaffold19_cov114-Cylindrotheca_fusiformis.AAC.20
MEKSQDEDKQEHGKRKNEESSQDNMSVDRISALRNHRMRFQDAIDPNAEVVTAVGKCDILLGRGRHYQDHDGNKRMRAVVDKYKEQYHAVRRSKKRGLVEAVYREIIHGGARFLKKMTRSNTDGDVFVVVDDEIAIQKVNNALRCKKAFYKAVASETQEGGSVVSMGNSIGNPINSGNMGCPPVARIGEGGDLPLNPSALQPLVNPLASPSATLQLSQISRFGPSNGLSRMPSIPTLYPQANLGYYDLMMRQNQFLQESLFWQQVNDARLLNAASASASIPVSSASSNVPTDEQRRASLRALCGKVEYKSSARDKEDH